jgi:apolipoprotein N-acyltransferase
VNGPDGAVGRLAVPGGRGEPKTLYGLDRLRVGLAQLRGWRRILAGMLLGALAVLALPPLYVVPALIPAFTGLAWLLESDGRARSAFATGWWFGLGYFVAGLYWVANALLTKPDEFGWLAPLAPIGLSLLLVPNIAIACCLARLLAPRPGIGFIITFASTWTIMEWVRSWSLTGFPWNLIGSVWTFSDAMIQSTSVIGTYGLGMVTVAAAAMPAEIVRVADRRAGAWPAAIAFAMLALLWAGGALRLAVQPPTLPIVDGVRLRLVQPNIPQNLKWRKDLVERHVAEQVAMGETPAKPAPTHIIWSEVSAPLFLLENAQTLRRIGKATPAGGVTIVGTLRRTDRQALELANSLAAIDSAGDIAGLYDKSHLVPFGEYMPLRDVVPLPAVAAGMADFAAGPGITTMHLPGVPPLSPLICYEVIFPGRVARTDERPGWLLNLTNDGWYGFSTGPYQHLAAARLRAVEEGLPLVRVANTGISAIVDPFGRVVARLGLGEKGVVDGPLPAALAKPTPYGRLGTGVPLALAVVLAGVGSLLSRSRAK